MVRFIVVECTVMILLADILAAGVVVLCCSIHVMAIITCTRQVDTCDFLLREGDLVFLEFS